jgi:nuclear pore complex protein Nup155
MMDPDSIGLEFWRAGLPVNDDRAEYYERRLRCYDLAVDSLAVFEERSAKASGNAADEAHSVRVHAFQLALKNEDEMFHSSFYDWLIGKGFIDQLLEVRLHRSVILKSHADLIFHRCGHRSWRII